MTVDILPPRRDVETSLTYWKPSKPIEIDFTKPGGEASYGELDSMDTSHKVTIKDARGIEDKFTLDKNGFTYAKHPIEGLDAATTEEEIQKIVVPATEELVKKTLGAHKTIVFTSRIRNVAQDTSKRAENRAPALSVHSDFTPAGGLQVFNTTVTDEAERARLAAGRVVLINVWRPLKTITRDPLCVSDWATVAPREDLVPLRFRFPDRWNELGKWTHSARHDWYYLHRQRNDEPLLFMQYDSKMADMGGMTVPHSAFDDAEHAGGPPRESIEIKMLAFIDE